MFRIVQLSRTPLRTLLTNTCQKNRLNIKKTAVALSQSRENFNFKLYTTEAAPKDEFHSIIKNDEKPTGQTTKHEFQAETRMLLDIVAKSLYSEKEVFLRELISNASDALEKFRYLLISDTDSKNLENTERPLEIHISTDKQNRILIIQDTGIGMSKDDLQSNLGIIAKSGSKKFLEELKKENADGSNIIGQFGVGFYSAFMVADKVEVYSKTSGQPGYKWSSDGTGSYEIQEADGVQNGTKLVLHLKLDSREFADEDTIKHIIQKYSNFVSSPIYLNGQKANIVQPIWLQDPKQVTPEKHQEFYRYISNNYDVPRYILHYKTDVPLSIRALLYFPEGKPGLFEMSRETETGVALYSRKVLIKSKTSNILPKWLRFVKGVVDSEDIPLNLSRELLQNSSLIRKLENVLTSRVIKFLQDQLTKKPEDYEKFYKDYGIFIKEGIISNHNQQEKEEAAKLLIFESSTQEGKKCSLSDYITRAQEEKIIYYLDAPSRQLAEASPYYESLKKKGKEVLFCYEPYDELVLLQLQQFKGYKLVSVEKDMRDDKSSSDLTNLGSDSLKRSEIDELNEWLKNKLSGKAASVSATTRLENHPCVVTVEEMAAARHFIRTQSHQLSEDRRFAILQPRLEINPRHTIIKKLYEFSKSKPDVAELLAKQLFANSMVGAGLADDPRVLLSSMNELLEKILEKY